VEDKQMLDIIFTIPVAIVFMLITLMAGYVIGKLKEDERWEEVAMAFCTMGDWGLKTHFTRRLMLLLNIVISIIWIYYIDTPVFVAFCMTIIVASHIAAYILNTRCGIPYPDKDAVKVMFLKK
jgi:hypothetical protein